LEENCRIVVKNEACVIFDLSRRQRSQSKLSKLKPNSKGVAL
jgi:hypothetical protein